MKAIKIIALNTFREIIRDRILYSLVIFAALLIGLSLALGQLSFSEQGRISANFGFTAIHLSAITLAVFIGSTLVSREIEKRTIFSLLVRPISREDFLFGKFFGLILIIFLLISGLSLILAFVLHQMDLPWTQQHFVAVLGIFLESVVMLSVVYLFGSFVTPLLTVVFSIGIFLIAHWVNDLEFFSTVSRSKMFKAVASATATILPNFERFNWRSPPVTGDIIPINEVFSATIYAACWTGVLLGVTILIFNKKDFS